MKPTRLRSLAAVLALTLLVACGSGTSGSDSPKSPDVGRSGDDATTEATATEGQDEELRINQIQTIGSHNSYRKLPSQEEQDLLRSFIGDEADKLEYEHLPLGEQFETQRIRQIELDVFIDRDGGKYAEPLIRTVAGEGPYEPELMVEPGLKVFHIQDVDYASTCPTLERCLHDVKDWSDANPTHVPIAVLLELKDTPLEHDGFEFTLPDLFEAADMDALDEVIRSVFPDEHLITPDDVRGDHDTLEEAVLGGDAWPTLAESRGKVLFLMDNGGSYRTTYLEGHPNLEGRVLFTNAEPGDPDAAFIKMNDPLETELITERVKAGYLVRTRADGDTMEARAGDTTKRDAALDSGAQWVSTDYPLPGLAIGFTSDYVAALPEGLTARCNPVTAPAGCVSEDLDTAGNPGPRR